MISFLMIMMMIRMMRPLIMAITVELMIIKVKMKRNKAILVSKDNLIRQTSAIYFMRVHVNRLLLCFVVC